MFKVTLMLFIVKWQHFMLRENLNSPSLLMNLELHIYVKEIFVCNVWFLAWKCAHIKR